LIKENKSKPLISTGLGSGIASLTGSATGMTGISVISSSSSNSSDECSTLCN